MKRKFVSVVICLLLTLQAAAACGKSNEPPFSLTGVQERVSAEVGTLFEIPEAVGKINGKVVDVEITVVDSVKAEVRVRNNKFTVTDLDGYEITFAIASDIGSKSEKTTVDVKDTVVPDLGLVEKEFFSKKGQKFAVPQPTATDNSGIAPTVSHKVFFDGKEVSEDEDGFVTTDYGEYTVKYEAVDTKGNIARDEIMVACSPCDVLNDFESGFNGLVPDHAVSGTALMYQGDPSYWGAIHVPVAVSDLSRYDYYQISVWAENDLSGGDNGFYLKNIKLPLGKGQNYVRISKAQMLAEYPSGIIASDVWFQLKCSTPTKVYVDDFVGIYINNDVDNIPPTIGLPYYDVTVLKGQPVFIPTAKVVDNSQEAITATYVVTDSSGNDVTSSVSGDVLTASLVGGYEILYSAADSANNVGTAKITVSVKDAKYDVLNAFETLGDFVSTYSSTEVTEGDPWRVSVLSADHAVSGNALKIGPAEFNWTPLKLKLPLNDLSAYDFFQLHIFNASAIPTNFYFYNAGPYAVAPGQNYINMSRAEFEANGAAGLTNYELLCQITGGLGVTLYVDNFVGVYDSFETDTQAPSLGMRENSVTLFDGQEFTIPTPFAVDNSGATPTVTYIVKDSTDTDVSQTVIDGKLTVSAAGGVTGYTVTYTAKDAQQNTSTIDFVVTLADGKIINNFSDGGVDQTNGETYFDFGALHQWGAPFQVSLNGETPDDYGTFEITFVTDNAVTLWINGERYEIITGYKK